MLRNHVTFVSCTATVLSILCFSTANQSFAQTIQTEADQHHEFWQQSSEGVIIAEHANSKTEYAAAGLTREGGSEPNKKTLFEIGSITKVFTSILLAEAVRENRANFDDAVSEHLTDLKFDKGSPFHKITLSELATHTSGLPRLPIDLSDGEDMDNPYVHYDDQRMNQSLISFRKYQLEEPGEHSYSNYGVGILGYVLTQIYDQTFGELLKDKILNPLKMNSTDVPYRFAELPQHMQERLATPHNGGQEVSHWELGSLVGAGAMISSAEDLIRFGTAHWDVETPDGLAASLAEVAKSRLDHQGLGWGIDGDKLSHDGGTGGFRANLEINSKEKTVHVFMANSAGVSFDTSTAGDFSSIEGYWSGVLNNGSENLRLLSFIDKTGRVVAYSIDQGFSPILSGQSKFEDDLFLFTFPTITAVYKGKLEDRDLIGSFVQAGNVAMPLKMKYSSDMPEILRSGLAKTIQGDVASLNGYWSGYLGDEDGLFVYTHITKIGELSVLQLYSPDQGKRPISVSSASFNDGIFEYHSDQINGTFSGKLTKDRKSIEGQWKQGPSSIPLTLHFSDEKPARK